MIDSPNILHPNVAGEAALTNIFVNIRMCVLDRNITRLNSTTKPYTLSLSRMQQHEKLSFHHVS